MPPIKETDGESKAKSYGADDAVEPEAKRSRISVGGSTDDYTRKHEFRQVFEHYVQNSDVTFKKQDNGVEFNEGFHYIPYCNSEASIRPQDWWGMVATADAVRPLSIGFRVLDIKYMIDERVTPGTAYTKCTYAGDPELFYYTDADHELAENLNRDLILKTSLPNKCFTQRYPRSRREGMLTQLTCEWQHPCNFGNSHDQLNMMHPMDYEAQYGSEGYITSLFNKPHMFKIGVDNVSEIHHTFVPSVPFKWWNITCPRVVHNSGGETYTLNKMPNRFEVVGDVQNHNSLKTENVDSECVDCLTHMIRFHGMAPVHALKICDILDRDGVPINQAVKLTVEYFSTWESTRKSTVSTMPRFNMSAGTRTGTSYEKCMADLRIGVRGGVPEYWFETKAKGRKNAEITYTLGGRDL
jgi:hypothetical protein